MSEETNEEWRLSTLKQLHEAHKALDRAETTFRGSCEFRDSVFALLEGTPFAAPVGVDFEGLYGRLRSALAARPPIGGAAPFRSVTIAALRERVKQERWRRPFIGAVGADDVLDWLEELTASAPPAPTEAQ